MSRRAWVIFGGLVFALTGVNALVIHKENIVQTGKTVYLELAPVDPRSLIQGDYMRLHYTVASNLTWSVEKIRDLSSEGYIVVQLDENGIGKFLRLHDGENPIALNEQLFEFKVRDNRVQVGSSAFFFQEGNAEHFNKAKYGELRVDPSGKSVLMALCDENLQRIQPEIISE